MLTPSEAEPDALMKDHTDRLVLLPDDRFCHAVECGDMVRLGLLNPFIP
jgi:hypothetical protein